MLDPVNSQRAVRAFRPPHCQLGRGNKESSHGSHGVHVHNVFLRLKNPSLRSRTDIERRRLVTGSFVPWPATIRFKELYKFGQLGESSSPSRAKNRATSRFKTDSAGRAKSDGIYRTNSSYYALSP